MNKKGFTVIELMTTFILVAIISTLLIKLVVTLKEIYISGDMKTALITKQSTMTDKIYKDLKNNGLIKIESCENTINCVNFVYTDGTKKFVIDKDNKTITYDNYTIKLGKEGYIGEVSLDKYNTDIGSIINFKVPIYNKLVSGDFGINITYQLDDDISFDNDIVFDVIEKGVTVTFDPDGGSLSKTTKEVTPGEKYGTLPEPTREGYIFKGWNGKNKFDRSKSNDNKVLQWSSGSTFNEAGSVVSDYIVVKNRTTYGSKYLIQVLLYDKNKNYIGKYNNVNHHVNNFTIDNSDVYYIRICFRVNNDLDMTTVNDLQLEEGEEATEYEPYYVKSDTKVTQNKNHTLTAIWEENE